MYKAKQLFYKLIKLIYNKSYYYIDKNSTEQRLTYTYRYLFYQLTCLQTAANEAALTSLEGVFYKSSSCVSHLVRQVVINA